MASIRLLKTNKWQLTAYLGYNPLTQKQIRKTKTISADGITKTQAQRMANAFEEDLRSSNVNHAVNNITLSQFLNYWWENFGNKQSVTTINRNKQLLVRIEGMLGHIKIEKLSSKHILAFIAQLESPDARLDGKGALASRTIAMHFKFLSSILNKAVKWRFIKNNPCLDVDPPKQKTKKQPIFQENELAKFLNLLLSKAPLMMQCFFLLAFTDGLRRSELCGIDESAIDFKEGTLEIKTVAVLDGSKVVYKDITKTAESGATMYLAPIVMDLLRKYIYDRTTQAKKLGIKRSTKIFTRIDGTPRSPYYFTRWLHRFCAENDLPKVNTQSFRKMGITYSMNVLNLKEASHFGRHSNINTTAEYYAEVLESRRKTPTMYLNQIVNNAILSDGTCIDSKNQ